MCTTESTKWVSREIPWWPSGYDSRLSHWHGLGSTPCQGTDMAQAAMYGPKIVGEGVSSKYNLEF